MVLDAAATRSKAARVILQKGKSGLFWGAGGNPIVYGGAVDRVTGPAPKNGDMVLLCDHNAQPMGFGAFNSDSMYRVRLLQTAAEAAADPLTCMDAERLVAARLSHPTHIFALLTGCSLLNAKCCTASVVLFCLNGSLMRVVRVQARLAAAAALRRRMGLPRKGEARLHPTSLTRPPACCRSHMASPLSHSGLHAIHVRSRQVRR